MSPTRPKVMNDVFDLKIEKFLHRVGVPSFELVENVELDRIAVEDSLHNQARIAKPLDLTAVDRYLQFLRDGIRFPPLVLWDRDDGKLFALDGNHRIAAHDKHGTNPDAYIVPRSTPQAIRTMISIGINGQHGLTLSADDRLAHALYLYNGKLTAAEAARHMGIAVSKLQGAIDIQRANERALELDADLPTNVWDGIKDTVKVILMRIRADRPFVAATQLAFDAGLSTGTVKELQVALRPIGNERKQLALIAEWRANLVNEIAAEATAGSGRERRGTMPLQVRAKLTLGQVSHLDPARLAGLSQRDRDDVAEAVTKSLARLQAVLEALKTGQAPPAEPAEPDLLTASETAATGAA